MHSLTVGREEFAAARKPVLDRAEQFLAPHVHDALLEYPTEGWYGDLLASVRQLFEQTFHDESGDPHHPNMHDSEAKLTGELARMLDRTGEPNPFTEPAITRILATATVNAATEFAASVDSADLVLEWVSMHDSATRETHKLADGERRELGAAFKVGESVLRYPGDPLGPLDEVINCRCVLRPDHALAQAALQSGETEEMAMTAPTEAPTEAPTLDTESVRPIPWHGVLAPMGVASGDKRTFAVDSLRNRDLPLPLTWQKASEDGHKQAIVVARIDGIEYRDNQALGHGVFLQTPEADEAVGLLNEFGRFGVSVDVDDAAFDLDTEEGSTTFSDARICSAAMVPIPAFQEAYISLGTWDDIPPGESAFAISEGSWDGSASRFTPEQWKRACIVHLGDGDDKSSHKLPIREPNGNLSRAGVHAAAGRISQVDAPAAAIASAKSQLRSAYKQLGEQPPDSLAGEDVETFDRGPGWITNPKGTERLHEYWTHGEGAAKIGWGTPGDFNRCRTEVGEEIGENNADKLRFLNQICAQWHFDALGYWPATHKKMLEGHAEQTEDFSVNLVASGYEFLPPADWFADPKLDGPTPYTQVAEGENTRIFGHLAAWETCHTSYPGTCVTAPHSETDYAYFKTGEVETDKGPLSIGNLTLGGGHADKTLNVRAALAHYDNVGTAVADVNVGEDEHGIWFAGWLRPGVTDQQKAELRAAALSGDWRWVKGGMELLAACAVNVPGFPIPRFPSVGVRNGSQVSLVAAGILEPSTEPEAIVPTIITVPANVAMGINSNTSGGYSIALGNGTLVSGGGGGNGYTWTDTGTATTSIGTFAVPPTSDDFLNRVVEELAARQSRQKRAREIVYKVNGSPKERMAALIQRVTGESEGGQ